MAEIPTILQPTLTQFENVLKAVEYVPEPNQSVVFEVGRGLIEITNKQKQIAGGTLKDNIDIVMYNRVVNCGYGEFIIRGFIDDIDEVTYGSLYVNEKSTLVIQDKFTLDSKTTLQNKILPEVNVDGHFTMAAQSILTIREGTVTFSNKASVLFAPDAKLIIDVPEDDNSYHLYINCDIEIDFSQLYQFIGNKNVYISDDVNIVVNNLPGNRKMSITDWITGTLNKKYQNINTVGSINLSNSSKITYRWRAGNPADMNDALSLTLDFGECILGDFDLRLTGIPNKLYSGQQIITDMTISKNATLRIITELENGMQYILPALHVTKFNATDIISKGFCKVEGKIECNGLGAAIELARGCQLTIEEDGVVSILNKACFKNINSDKEPILIINGTLIIDDIAAMGNLVAENIQIGENGKIIILNNSDDILNGHNLLFTTPNGIMDSKLYELFGKVLNHVEYHIQPNCGIKVDEYFEYYSFMTWYNHLGTEKMDITQAIENNMIVWHENAFIELDQNIIPYINESSSLATAGNILNGYGDEQERLQSNAIRLSSAGAGNVVFRFVYGNTSHDVTLTTIGTKVVRTLYNSIKDLYRVYTDKNQGTLYLNNNVESVNSDSIITDRSLTFPIDESSITDIKIEKE